MWPFIIILLINLTLYFKTLWCGLVMDDMQWYEKMKAQGWTKGINPIHSLSERLYSGGVFGFNPTVDHAVTMVLWTILCELIYVAFGHNQVSFMAALLCSVHPLMNQLSIWINGRRYLICAIILMTIMSAFPWALPLYFLAQAFQVTILFAPVLFITKPILALYALMIFLASLFIIKDWLMGKIKTRLETILADDMREWKPRRPILVVKIYGFYFFKMILPARVQMVYPFMQMFGRTKQGNADAYKIDGNFIRGVVSIILTIGLFIIMPWNYRPWVAFMAISLLQWCGIVSVTQLIADRYAGIPTIFMCFFISFLSLHYLPSPWGHCVIALLIGSYISSTLTVMKMYKNIETWYDYHIFEDFSNLAVVNLRIGMLMSQRKLFQANTLIEKGLEYYPEDYALNYLGYISAMICQHIPLAQAYLLKCRDCIYLGEEKERAQELADADLGLRAMRGELNLKQK